MKKVLENLIFIKRRKNNLITYIFIITLILGILFYFLSPRIVSGNLASELTEQEFYKLLKKAEQNNTKALKKIDLHYALSPSADHEYNIWMVYCKGASIGDKIFIGWLEEKKVSYQLAKEVKGSTLHIPACPKYPLRGLQYMY
jgi:hypothetical protein